MFAVLVERRRASRPARAAARRAARSRRARRPRPRRNRRPPTVRLYLVTDLAGALEPCGCTKDQLGGLDHFGAWVKREQPHAPAALVASAGPLFFMDDKLEGERADQDRIKAQTIARVLHGLGFAAFAPGTNDWADGSGRARRARAQASGGAVILGDGRTPSCARSAASRSASSATGRRRGRTPTADVEDAVKRGVEDAKKQGRRGPRGARGRRTRRGQAHRRRRARAHGGRRRLRPVRTGDSNTHRAAGRAGGRRAHRPGRRTTCRASRCSTSTCASRSSPGRCVKFADATGLELAQKREELARRIDELHVKIAAWERDPKVAPADVAARRQELATLEAQRDGARHQAAARQGQLLPLRGQGDARLARQGPGGRGGHARLLQGRRRPQPRRLRRSPAAAAARRTRPTYVGVEACSSCHPGPREVWNSTPPRARLRDARRRSSRSSTSSA